MGDMSRLLHPDFWSPRQKPGCLLAPRRGHPLASGLIRAWVPNQSHHLVDLIGGDAPTPGANFQGVVIEGAEIALRPGSVQSSGANGLKTATSVPYGANGTIIVRACSKIGLGVNNAPFILDAQSSSSRTLIYMSGATANRWGWYLGGTVIFDAGAGEITDLFDNGVPTTVAFTWTSGNVQNVYKNGALAGASPYGVTAAPVAQAVTIGDRFAASATVYTGLGGPIEYIYFYDRALSGDEVRAQFDEPFSMWEPAEEWPEPWLAVAAGGGTTYNQACLASSAPLASLLRQTNKPLTASQTGVATLDVIRAFLTTLTASSQPAATLARAVGKIATATTTSLATLIRSTGKPTTASSTPAATAAKQTAKALTATQTGVATLGAIRAFLLSLTASSTSVGTVARSIGRPITASSTAVATLARATAKALTATTASAASAVKSIAKAFGAASTSLASLVATLLEGGAKVVTATASETLLTVATASDARVIRATASEAIV